MRVRRYNRLHHNHAGLTGAHVSHTSRASPAFKKLKFYCRTCHFPSNGDCSTESRHQSKISYTRAAGAGCCRVLRVQTGRRHKNRNMPGWRLTSSMMTTWYWGSLGSAVSMRRSTPSVRNVTFVPRPAVESNRTRYAMSSLCSCRVSKATLYIRTTITVLNRGFAGGF